MSQACPHCEIALPTTVDAFCPECRRDMSEQRDDPVVPLRPVSAAPGARRTEEPRGPADAVISAAGYAAHGIMGVFGLLVAVPIFIGAGRAFLDGEFGQGLLFTLFGLGWAGWALSGYEDARGERTSTTGYGKTTKDSEQTQ